MFRFDGMEYTAKMNLLHSHARSKKNLEESKMSDRDRIENEFKTNLNRI